MVVAQLVKPPLLTPEVSGSNPVIGKIFILNVYCQLYWKYENKEKRSREWLFFIKQQQCPNIEKMIKQTRMVEMERAQRRNAFLCQLWCREHFRVENADRWEDKCGRKFILYNLSMLKGKWTKSITMVFYFFYIKMSHPWPFFVYFWSFSNKRYKFYSKLMWKMSIHYPVTGFKLTIFWLWVSSFNN